MANDKKVDETEAALLERLMGKFAEAMQKGMTDGISLAEMARGEAAKLIATQKRGFVPKETCLKCRQPVNVCGGPEMVGKLDKDNKAVLDANGKSELVEKTKWNEADANHSLMSVTVSDPDAERYFRGAVINGVNYRSRNGNHKILVPKDNDIASICAMYEKNEKEQRVGKIVQHDSGTVGRGTGRSKFTPFPAIQR